MSVVVGYLSDTLPFVRDVFIENAELEMPEDFFFHNNTRQVVISDIVEHCCMHVLLVM